LPFAWSFPFPRGIDMCAITAEKGFLADGSFRRAFPADTCQWLGG
jgi:hypothetical protein